MSREKTGSEHPCYLGDGVYATFDGYHTWLRTGSHEEGSATNAIALEPSVFAALLEYERQIRKAERLITALVDAPSGGESERRALDELAVACAPLSRDPEVAATLADIRADRIAELEAELKALRPAATDHVPWLVKDFHALYRAAEATMGLSTFEETKAAREALRVQLVRLLPAFEECEAARRMAGQTKAGN